jgi:hypothetical protein
MKNNVRVLARMIAIFGEDTFYCVSTTTYTIQCQGSFKSDLALKLKNLKFTTELSNYGYVEFKRIIGDKKINVTLT